ncbi:MAG: type IV pili twitching motility protein PilT [Candidatus Pacebacteria bacterium CG10_big_fil_rev_8_21_14_0_10_36_11]|nr:type IV pilus twitching motility protein PilT [Candidatus Pacearchaeota archaeon]OIP74080.1 MAG: type IV pili twitching motility protein PilT [Candidatus Pacebacteria bacterium CG2_30_36_39]PIR64447.1 MAG: type IV pili twitching motility protein PilT [Candidatus Pacebacteria bacterium CG10_big_fil_rev_8_21_14_0_10_36_11]
MSQITIQESTIKALLDLLITQNGSDLHLLVGVVPTLRVNGRLHPVENMAPLTNEDSKALIFPLLTKKQQEYVLENKELDFGYEHTNRARFRINVYYEKDNLSAAMRFIPSKIRSIDELGLPTIFHQFTQYSQGLILITGPTGEGKSTTLAAMIDEVNHTRAEHILTIEDPIEFVYEHDKSIISQREVNRDTFSWEMSLRSALREDPDVVLIGEMRDFETIAAAITIAETGHLVLATLHTATAAQTIDRIIDVFPAHQQSQIRMQLAGSLQAVVSQRLVTKVDGSLTAAFEIMMANSAVRSMIREEKTHQLDGVIQTSAQDGMMLFENHLAQLIQQGTISKDSALRKAFRPAELLRLIGE